MGRGHSHHQPPEFVSPNAADLALARRVTLWGGLLGAALALIQGALGFLFGSRALIADASHSLADLVTDIVVWVGLRLSAKPADNEFPYGRGKYETLAAMAVAISLACVAVGITVDAGKSLLGQGDKTTMSPWLILGALAGIVTKEFIYRWTIRVGRRLRSNSMIANAWHHRSDALSSVAVLVGLTGGLVFDAWWLDPLTAVVVAGMIFRVTWEVLRQTYRSLLDASVPPETRQRIAAAAVEDPAVVDVHSLRARSVGSAIYVDLHAVVHGEMSVREACQIAGRLERHVRAEVKSVVEVLVHVEPAPDGAILTPSGGPHPGS